MPAFTHTRYYLCVRTEWVGSRHSLHCQACLHRVLGLDGARSACPCLVGRRALQALAAKEGSFKRSA